MARIQLEELEPPALLERLADDVLLADLALALPVVDLLLDLLLRLPVLLVPVLLVVDRLPVVLEAVLLFVGVLRALVLPAVLVDLLAELAVLFALWLVVLPAAFLLEDLRVFDVPVDVF